MYHVKRKLAYFGARSLYPSAMNMTKGYLQGTPKVLNTSQLNCSFISSQDGYFIRIRISWVGKSRKFPRSSKRTESGVRMFSNDIVGEFVHVDETALDDAISFQEIEFEILDVLLQ